MELQYFKQAYELNELHKRILLENNVHFRASRNSVSLISVSNEKPELGVKCKYKKWPSEIPSGSILKDIQKIKNKSTPARKTPEKELQSLIIKYALNNNNQLPFDTEIKFITSELAMVNENGKKIVTDLLGYNEGNNQLYIIELKSNRLLKRLIQQVNNFEKIINSNLILFENILSIYGFSKIKDIKKLVIWPHATTSPKIELMKENISEITYLKNYEFKTYY